MFRTTALQDQERSSTAKEHLSLMECDWSLKLKRDTSFRPEQLTLEYFKLADYLRISEIQ